MAMANAVAMLVNKRKYLFQILKTSDDKNLAIPRKILSGSHIIYYFCRLIKKLILNLVMITAAPVAAQKASTTVQQIWFSYHNQIRLSNRWGLWNDAQLRTGDKFTRDFSVYILRSGLVYHITDDLRLTAGYAFAHYFPSSARGAHTEHRPWQQILWQNRMPSFRFTQSVRLEERFRQKLVSNGPPGNGFDFNYRLRYNLVMNFAPGKKPFKPKTFSYTLSDDVHFNFGKQVVYNNFDQNRVFSAIQYHTEEQDFLQLGYLCIYQQIGASRYRYTHAARITYMHILDLRKNKRKEQAQVVDLD